jgi:hypothetical protein
MDPPPAVLDRPFDLHQVLEGVPGEREGDSKVATPSGEEDEKGDEGDGRFSEKCEGSRASIRRRTHDHTPRIGDSAFRR